MARAKVKARKALKAKQTRDVLRDRDRKLSAFNQLLPPDSDSPPPARILRSNINSHRLPALSPPLETLESLKGLRMEIQAYQFKERSQLMSTESTDVLDLTNIDSSKFAEDNKSCTPPDDGQGFMVFFSAGFQGYSKHTAGQWKKVSLQCLADSKKFTALAHRMLQYQLSGIGLRNDEAKISGYEIRVQRDCNFHGLAMQAGQRVLVQSNEMLLAWAGQVMHHNKVEQNEIVIRIVKKDGTKFDATFRASRRYLALPIKPSDSIEPGMQDSRVHFTTTEKFSKRQKKRVRRRATPHEAVLDSAQIEAKTEEAKRKQKLWSDTRLIERMMAGQYLSGSMTDRSVTRASSLPNDVSQRNDGPAYTQNEVEGEEEAGMDVDMA